MLAIDKVYYHLYVDDKHIDTILSGWPVARIMRELAKKNPDARTLEVRKHETDESFYLLSGN